MSNLLQIQPELAKVQESLRGLGVTTSIPHERFDFEQDYPKSTHLGTEDGIGNVGVLVLDDSPIDYIQILKKQKFVKCDYVMGGHVRMGVHMHSWYKFKFFLSFPKKIHLGPLDMGTITTIKKGLMHSKIQDFVWSGYQKLTTLPPGLVRDSVAEELSQDQRLQVLMTKCLLKEKIIKVSRYVSQKTVEKKDSKIVIESQWKIQRDLKIDAETFEMYERIAEDIKSKVDELKYHLTYN